MKAQNIRICNFFLLFMLMIPCVAFAQNIVWNTTDIKKDIGNEVYILNDAEGKLSFDEVLKSKTQASFKKSEKINLTLGYTTDVFWVKFSIQNNTEKDLILEIAQAGLPDCDLYFKDINDSTKIYKAGSNTTFDERKIKSSFQVFPLVQHVKDYYIRLTTNSGPIPIRIYNKENYDEKSISQKFVYGIYLGLMFFVFISNIFFFFSLRNFLYLANSLNVIIFICYSMVVVDGFVVYFFKKIDMLFWYTTIPPIGVTIQTIYTLWFLEVKKFAPKLYRSISILVICYALWLVAKFFLPFPIVQPINTLQALLSFFVMGYIGIRVGKKGNKFGYLIALTYFLYFLLVLAEATYINIGKPTYLLGFSYSGYATILEALALSFLLTKRFELEKIEIENAKAAAQKMVIEKTLENERIVREQNSLLEQKVEERTSQLKEEKQKSDNLLYNILPEEVAEELKMKGEASARQFDNVTVLFTDFVGFTQITENTNPQELVQEIHYCFSTFDKIIEKNGLEKIKTIGDAYLAVCGLPISNENHAEKTVNAAIEIINFIQDYSKNGGLFKIRVGIHTGSVIAGIVGVKKFAYDIWGDTVNTAARMEQNSINGKINISGTTYQLIQDIYVCEHRGKLPVKNKGDIDMYFIAHKK